MSKPEPVEELQSTFMGGLRMFLGGQDLTQTSLPKKAQAILTYLILNPRTHSRQEIAGKFWPEVPENRARVSLRVALNKMKEQGLEPFLIAPRTTLAFDRTKPYWCDVEAFENILAGFRRQGGDDLELLRQAVDLYRGDFLDGFDAEDAFGFEEWMLNQRESLRQGALRALGDLVRLYLDGDQFAVGIEYAHRLLELESWRESAHRQLMWLFAKSGNRAAALEQYEKCREILQNELGIEPDPGTTAVYEEIKNLEYMTRPYQPLPPVSPAEEAEGPPFQAPALEKNFSGRHQPLARLVAALTAVSGNRRYGLVGMGGVGKTTLAVHLAHQLRPHFADGVLWATAVTSDPMEIAEKWANALGYDFTGLTTLEERTRALRAMLAEKDVLLVVDDVTVVSSIKLLLPEADKTAVLFTSRRSDVIFNLDARSVNLHELSAENSWELLALHIGEERAGQESEAVAEICRLVQHLPLAVAIAGGYLNSRPNRSLATFVNQLQSETSRLGLDYADREVRASIRISWGGLDDTQKRIFTLLGMFNGRDFGVEAIASIAQMDFYRTLDRLDDLVRLSLLKNMGPHRYQQHALLADFAQEKLGEDAEAYRRLAAYYLIFATDFREDYAALRPEWDNLRAGIETAYQRQMWQEVIDYTIVLGEAWFKHGRYSEARRSFKWASEAAMTLEDEKTLAANWLYWGQACIEQGDSQEAESLIENSLTLYQELEDLAGISAALCDLARISLERSDFDKAEALLEESYHLSQRLNDDKGTAQVMYRQARIAYDQANYNHGRQLLDNALTIYERIGDTTGFIRTLRLSAGYMLAAAENEGANEQYNRAFELAEAIQDQGEMAVALRGLATTNRYLGRLELAQEFAEKSLNLLEHMGDRYNKARVLRELGRIHFAAQAYETALDFGLQSLDICYELPAELITAYLQLDVGRAYAALGQIESACAIWTDALGRAEHTQNERLKEDILAELRKCGD